jgi:hypothetical protein
MAFTTKITGQTYSDAKLDLDADQIQQSANGLSAIIFEERHKMDLAGRDAEPLYIILGESHSRVAHKIHHMLVLDTIAKSSESMSIGIEHSHDFYAKLCSAYGQAAQSQAMDFLDANDLRDVFNVRSMMNYKDMPYSSYTPFGFANLITSQFNAGRLVKCTDASQLMKFECNLDDSSTRDAFRAVERDLDFFYSSPETDDDRFKLWMYVRNVHMITSLREMAEARSDRFAIQLAGSAHVAGLQRAEIPFGEGLAGVLESSKLSYVAHVPCDQGVSPVFPRLEVASGRNVLTSELPDDIAQYTLPGQRSIYSKGPIECEVSGELRCTADEESYYKAVLERLGLAHCFNSQDEIDGMAASISSHIADVYGVPKP